MLIYVSIFQSETQNFQNFQKIPFEILSESLSFQKNKFFFKRVENAWKTIHNKVRVFLINQIRSCILLNDLITFVHILQSITESLHRLTHFVNGVQMAKGSFDRIRVSVFRFGDQVDRTHHGLRINKRIMIFWFSRHNIFRNWYWKLSFCKTANFDS